MSTTPNHLAHSRAQLAEASELADAGSNALARIRLLSAADHALIALAARSAADEHLHTHAELDRLRDLEDDSAGYMQDPALAARLTAGFGAVQQLIDASLAHPAGPAPHEVAPRVPMYGGPRGAMNGRGAEAAVRGLTRIAAAIRAALRR